MYSFPTITATKLNSNSHILKQH